MLLLFLLDMLYSLRSSFNQLVALSRTVKMQPMLYVDGSQYNSCNLAFSATCYTVAGNIILTIGLSVSLKLLMNLDKI